MNNKRIARLLSSILIGIIAAAAIAFMQSPHAPKNADVVTGNGLVGKPFGGDFAGLLDQDGKVLERDAFHDTYELVFFGFTHCPAVCPTELQKLAHILKNLPPMKRAKLSVLFVSVDPVRDTPDKMKAYISAFDLGIIGITGHQERIDQVLGDWKIYAAKVPLENGDYTMDHSAFLYLRGPEGVLEGVFPLETPAETIQAEIASKIRG